MSAPAPLAREPALYLGHVVHQRRRPRPHRLAHRIPLLLLDPTEAAGLARRLRLFSTRRLAPLGFSQTDHGDGAPGGLLGWTADRLAERGIAAPDSIRVLAMPRTFGRVFNPLTLIFACDAAGVPFAVLWQVNNTFGERHVYVLAIGPEGVGADGTIRQGCAKAFHVSPFLPMALDYRFRVAIAPARLSVLVTVHDRSGPERSAPVLAASVTARRVPLTDLSLARLLLRHGWLEGKVLAAIHLEAWRLWRKRLRLFPHPGPRPMAGGHP